MMRGVVGMAEQDEQHTAIVLKDEMNVSVLTLY